jgi:hypothetical protein
LKNLKGALKKCMNIYILADPANVVLPYKLFLGNFLV